MKIISFWDNLQTWQSLFYGKNNKKKDTVDSRYLDLAYLE